MGFFDWLRPRPQIAITFWLDDGSRARGFVRAVIDDLARGDHVLVVGHFKDALVRTGQALAAAGVTFVTQDRWTDADTQRLSQPPTGAPFVVLASRLPAVPEGRPQPVPAPGAAAVSVQLCDLHVLPAANERIARFVASLPAPTRLRASVSFDDAIMAQFASPWVKTMMSTMGLRADDPIDSPMVAKGLQRALRKLAKRATGDVPCDSVQEWLRRNLAP